MTRAPEDIVQAVYDLAQKGIRVVVVAGGGGGGVTPGTPEHRNGTAGTTPAPVTFSAATKSVLFRNAHIANDLLVSFDGGAAFFTIPPGAALGLDCAVSGAVVKAGADGTPYECIATV